MGSRPRINFANKLVLHVSALLTLVAIYAPFYIMFITSLKSWSEVFSSPPTWFPQIVQWMNYVEIWQFVPIGRYLLNSTIISVGATAICMGIATPAAYAVSRFKPGNRAISMNLILFLHLFSDVVLLAPIFRLYVFFNLLNTYYSLILVNAAFALGFVIWILTPAFLSIPRDLEDSASVDGCSRLQTFVRIMLPLCIPSLIAGAILVLVWTWSEFLFALTLVTDDALRPITSGLYLFRGARADAPIYWQYLMAASGVAITPIVILFTFLQKWFKGEVVVGALKG